jgi:hypothetical protein
MACIDNLMQIFHPSGVLLLMRRSASYRTVQFNMAISFCLGPFITFLTLILMLSSFNWYTLRGHLCSPVELLFLLTGVWCLSSF